MNGHAGMVTVDRLSNMKFIDHHLKTLYGGPIIIRKVDEPDGNFVCPICGDPNQVAAPWNDGVMSTDPKISENAEFSFGSQETCPCCEMEFGLEGEPPTDGSWTMERIWMEWRIKWLRECHWSEDAIAQLSNIGFTRDEVLEWKAKDEA